MVDGDGESHLREHKEQALHTARETRIFPGHGRFHHRRNPQQPVFWRLNSKGQNRYNLLIQALSVSCHCINDQGFQILRLSRIHGMFSPFLLCSVS